MTTAVAQHHVGVGATPAAEDRRIVDRRVWVALGLLTLIAAALRLPFLNHQSFWFDEIYTRQVVGEPTLAGLWNHIKASESTPPLYYLLTWLLPGRSEAVLRLIPALALTASVPVGYLAFRRLLGEVRSLAPAAILAVSPELVQYGTDARSYGLYVLTSLLTIWAFFAVLERWTPKRYALWALASVLCIWTHYFGFFFVAAEAIALLVIRREAWRATVAWSAGVSVLLVPLLPLVTAQTDSRANFIAVRPLRVRLEQLVREFAMGANVPRTWLEAAGLALACGAVAYGAFYAVRADARWRALLWIAAFGVGAPLLVGVLGIFDRFDPRNVMPALPLAAALATPALLRLRGLPLAVYLCLALLTSLWVATNWRYEQLDYRGALATAKRVDPQAAIMTPSLLYEPVAATYIGHGPSKRPPSSRSVWLLVEPKNGVGQRALHPQPPPPGPAGFTESRALLVHGFRLLLFEAPAPRQVVYPGLIVFAPPVRG
jgi:4-amino-4-deoxy-L-arabinose transferase-like glycosyltransferase